MSRKIILFFLFLYSILSVSAQAREIVDMTGRRVTLPDAIRRVFTASPPATYMMYAVDPALLVGSNFTVRERERRFLRPEFTRLPVIGGIYGQGRSINMEALLALKPDIVLSWSSYGAKTDDLFVEQMRKAGIPVVFVKLDRLEEYPATFRFMGELLGRKERCRELSSYAAETVKKVSAAVSGIPARKRVTVYYAEGSDGLSTEGENSWHAQLIPLAGGINVHRGMSPDNAGMEKVSMEQVLIYNPEVILTHDRNFYDSIWNDRRWTPLRAVSGKKVYLIPNIPFNWFDRPPSFMRLIGLKWLTALLYPDRYAIDIKAETRAFYRLFLGVETTDRDLQEILSR